MPNLSKSEYKQLVLKLVKQYEKELDVYNSYVLARQIREYENISRLFETLIKELTEKANGLSPNQIFKLSQYRDFAQEIEKQLAIYARFSANITTIAQRDFANMALKNSNTLLTAISSNFNRFPKEAISKIIGLTADGSPLLEILQDRFKERVEEATQLLIEGIARGSNPRLVARNMVNQLDISRYDAVRIARTEAINTYSAVTYDSYKASGIVESYLLIAESDACEECLAVESGSPYPMDDTEHLPTIHPHCRCAIAPNIG